MSASDICDALKPAMTEITIDGVTAKDLTWKRAVSRARSHGLLKISKTSRR